MGRYEMPSCLSVCSVLPVLLILIRHSLVNARPNLKNHCFIYESESQSVVLWLDISASPGNQKMQSLKQPHSRPTESYALGRGSSNLGFNKVCR